MKVVRPELARDTEFIRRFRHEVTAAQRVSGAFTAPVIAADLDANPPWLATAFVPGPSLQDWVDASGPLPEPAIRLLAAGLAEALSAVHACGLVHRDLKPSNVLLAEDGPRVIDFGISRARYGTAVTTPGYVVGTPPFMSPEQAKGSEVGPASDIFALGAVLCLAATGRAPFGDEDSMVVLYRIVHEQPAIDTIPVPLRNLIARCLAKDPAVRPQPAELMRAFSDGATDPRIAAGSFWPPEVAQRVRDFSAGLDKGLPEPMVVAPSTPLTRAEAAQVGAAQAEAARAEPVTRTSAVPVARPTGPATRPKRRRRELAIGGGATLAVAAVLLAILLPGSPRHPSSDPRADAVATHSAAHGAALRGQTAPADTANTTNATNTHQPPTKATGHPTSPATESSPPAPSRKPQTQATHQVTGSPAAAIPPAAGVALQCGSSCVALFSLPYGKSEVLSVVGSGQNAGQAVDLQSASSGNTAADWLSQSAGRVSVYYRSGLVSTATDRQFGNDYAYEYEYAPAGVSSGLCLGVALTAQNGTAVILQPCGVSAKTVWVADSAAQNGEQVPLINGSETSSAQPLVLSVNGTGVNATTSTLGAAAGQYWRTEN